MRIRIRRTGRSRRALFGRRDEYAVEVVDDAGSVLFDGPTETPTSVLASRAGVHTTDAHDWRARADELFESGSTDWVTDPHGGRRA